jgi:hypothetical protein
MSVSALRAGRQERHESRNFLYPYFSLISGEKESGFQFWPCTENRRRKASTANDSPWAVLFQEEKRFSTPTVRKEILPLSFIRPRNRGNAPSALLWPTSAMSRTGKEGKSGLLWPFRCNVRSGSRNWTVSPFYSEDRRKKRV